jgi:hypothetical protein
MAQMSDTWHILFHYVYYFSSRFCCFLWFTPKFISLDLTISIFCAHPFLYQFQRTGMGPHGWWIGFASNFLLLHPTFLCLHRSLSAQPGSVFHKVRFIDFVLCWMRIFFNHLMYFMLPNLLDFIEKQLPCFLFCRLFHNFITCTL